MTRDAPADLVEVEEVLVAEPALDFAPPEALDNNHVRFGDEKEGRAYVELRATLVNVAEVIVVGEEPEVVGTVAPVVPKE